MSPSTKQTTTPAAFSQPLTRSKILPRDISHLRGLPVSTRYTYLLLAAMSDSGGRLRREDARLAEAGIQTKTLARLASEDLVSLYRHDGLNVLFVPGGRAASGFNGSKLAPLPDDLPSRVPGLAAGEVLYAGLEEALKDMDPLEASVWHVLLCLADAYGRGLFAPGTVTDALGRVRLADGTQVTRQLVQDAFQRLHDHGFLQAYSAKGRTCYAILDARQLCKWMPKAKVPPPEGCRWDWSFDSPEGLEWRSAREERLEKKRQDKRAARAAAPRKPKEDKPSDPVIAKLEQKLAHAKPHLEYICGKSNPAIYVCHAVSKLPGLDVGLVQIALTDLRLQPVTVIDWVVEKTGRSLEELEAEYNGMITLTPGVGKTEKPRHVPPSNWCGPVPKPIVQPIL